MRRLALRTFTCTREYPRRYWSLNYTLLTAAADSQNAGSYTSRENYYPAM